MPFINNNNVTFTLVMVAVIAFTIKKKVCNTCVFYHLLRKKSQIINNFFVMKC